MTTLAIHPSLLPSLGIAALVVWRLYSRIRRMVGRQRLSPVRPWLTVAVFPILLVYLAQASLGQPEKLLMLLAGAVIGTLLGRYGIRLTKFEASEQGRFYTPSAHLGIALSLLFIGRIVYRLAGLYLSGGSLSSPPSGFIAHPVTLLIFATLAGYYVSYAVGLLRWARSLAKA
ncbi:hypothetical protein [Chromobacterium sphagni]|uniref:DUF1453 domain-containing protein n=1 Tax=Chromobacterium sphagni TaxID=1903179 RepID=A0ABX3C8I2_9NEIS|nr:hypothetical protein [Chromobacterium sphagni]OHX17034.1 hypothetical protein BI344_12275 [Chromobacterium sphagni]